MSDVANNEALLRINAMLREKDAMLQNALQTICSLKGELAVIQAREAAARERADKIMSGEIKIEPKDQPDLPHLNGDARPEA